ncbi:hypothetical protein [Streptococcus oricebi]|uniref:Cingulin n=1 Tax=Streptococcus oricebi TaxID=1547447 RepID=A0ABS5B637_9STRE|nr:hypothetical protein [Streptococcus oricebi]MBP2624309.1 hypothetical protein [Streptococcus oricebi]
MEKFDLVQSEILKKKLALEKLEDQYHSDKKNLEDQYNELDVRQRDLRRMIESKYDIALHQLKHLDMDTDAEFSLLNREITTYLEVTETTFMDYCQKLDKRDEELEQQFKADHGRLSQALEADYKLRQKLEDEKG